jgi:hypothetical protein
MSKMEKWYHFASNEFPYSTASVVADNIDRAKEVATSLLGHSNFKLKTIKLKDTVDFRDVVHIHIEHTPSLEESLI